MELTDAVHTFALTFDQGGREITIHPAAIETERGLLLLDAGPEGSLDQLRDCLGAAGFSLADVATVLVTHHDGDHVAGLAALQTAVDPYVLAHERAAPPVDGREAPRGDGERYPTARVDLEFADTVTLHTRAGPARVIPTPGHTPGHVSVYLPDERLLFAADALTADEEGLQPPYAQFTESMSEALDSARRLAALDVERTHCFHGGTVAAGSDRIAEIAADGD